MTKDINSWDTVTNHWIKFWSESSSVIWKNWFVLLGLDSQSKTSEVNDEVVSQSQQSSGVNFSSIDIYMKKLVNLTKLSKNFSDWQKLQNFWLEVAEILLNYNSENVSQKISNFIDNIENFQLNNQEQQVLIDNTIHQTKSLEENKEVHLLENFSQVQLVEKTLILKQEEYFTDRVQELKQLEQENKQKFHTIEELHNKIKQLEEEKKLNKEQNLLSQKNDSVNLSAMESELQWLKQQLQLKEEQLRTTQQKITDKANDCWRLEQENEKKSQTIKELQAKINQLESIAAIGNRQLNKWRSKTFFN